MIFKSCYSLRAGKNGGNISLPHLFHASGQRGDAVHTRFHQQFERHLQIRSAAAINNAKCFANCCANFKHSPVWFAGAEEGLALNAQPQGKRRIRLSGKHGNRALRETLMDMCNTMLQDECLELSWQDPLFKMLPRTGEFSDVSNWRPIAVLKITYKIFAKLIHTRIAHLLDANQTHDQVGFRPNLGVDHAFATLDSIVGKCLEWNEPLWIASLDLRKAF